MKGHLIGVVSETKDTPVIKDFTESIFAQLY